MNLITFELLKLFKFNDSNEVQTLKIDCILITFEVLNYLNLMIVIFHN